MRLARLLCALSVPLALLASSARGQCPMMDDMFEDNDTCPAAVPLANGSYLDLYVEKLDSDFYVLTAPAGMYVVVKLRFTHASGDIDVFLYDAACNGPLVQSTSGNDDEGLAFLNTGVTTATYVLEVQVWPGSAVDCNRYDLIISNSVDPCTLPDDGLEENDSCGGAVPLPIGTTTGLWVDKIDLDYYSVTLQHGETLTADVLFCDALADVDVILYDTSISCGGGSGSGVTQSTTATDNERIIWTNTTGAPNTYIMEVYVWVPGIGDCNTYDLAVSGVSGPIGTSYCGPAVPNSTGLPGEISAEGSVAVVDNDLELTAEILPPGQFGYFLAGRTQGFFNPPGSSGFICLMGNIGRFNQVANIIVGPTGSITVDLTAVPVNPTSPVNPGETWNFQCWYRDIGGTSNFTDGVSIAFQ